jgi:hypothetical protein
VSQPFNSVPKSSSFNNTASLVALCRALNCSNEVIKELREWIKIYTEHSFKTQSEVNNYITNNHRWNEFPIIRSLNDHEECKNIPGIQEKYYAIVSRHLGLTGKGRPLTRSRHY